MPHGWPIGATTTTRVSWRMDDNSHDRGSARDDHDHDLPSGRIGAPSS